MTTPKTLGQIAYEADAIHSDTWGAWTEASSTTQYHYERIAQAVAREVKRRGKKGKGNASN